MKLFSKKKKPINGSTIKKLHFSKRIDPVNKTSGKLFNNASGPAIYNGNPQWNNADGTELPVAENANIQTLGLNTTVAAATATEATNNTANSSTTKSCSCNDSMFSKHACPFAVGLLIGVVVTYFVAKK